MRGNLAIKIIAPIVILAFGAAVVFVLIKTRPEAAKAQPKAQAPLVTAVGVERDLHQRTVVGHGSVLPSRQIALQPEISGRVVAVNPQLVPGGRMPEGEPMLRINARDYQLALTAQNAQVEQARFNLELEQSRKTIAEREWELLGRDIDSATETGRALALREPHKRSAEASLESAKSPGPEGVSPWIRSPSA